MKKILCLFLTFITLISFSTLAFADENEITVTVDCSKVVFDQQPIILEGRTLVPLRAIFEKLGAEVSWDDATKTATAVKDDITVKIQNQNNVMKKNSQDIVLDVPAQIINSRTLVPVRAISEAFGCSVDWFSDTRTVTVLSDELLNVMYDATSLLGKKEYNAEDTFTYGELANAAVTIIMNEKETSYFGLETKEPFSHTYARDFYYICVNILGEDFLLEENISKPATLKDTAEVLSFAVSKHDMENETISASRLLNGKDGTAVATMKQFSEFITRLDEVSPLLVKIVLTKGNTFSNVQTKIRKDLPAYPQNSSKYKVILEDLPNSVYEKDIYNGNSSNLPMDSYDFVRDYRDILLNVISPWIDEAAKKGIEIEVEYYPSLCVNNQNGYTMRTVCNILTVPNDSTTASDIFTNTPGSKTILTAGSSYVIDLCNNAIVDAVVMPHQNLSMKRLIKLK